jgi:hypothetical protein
VSDNRARYPIAVMCRILGVSLSIYYAWVKRPARARALMDTASTVEIRAAHAASKGTYEHHVCRLILRKPAFVSVANVWPGVAMRKSSGSISARRVRISPAPRQADVLQAYVRDADLFRDHAGAGLP